MRHHLRLEIWDIRVIPIENWDLRFEIWDMRCIPIEIWAKSLQGRAAYSLPNAKYVFLDFTTDEMINSIFWPFLANFSAIYINIFHKTEVQMVILRCWTGLSLNWLFKSYDTKCKWKEYAALLQRLFGCIALPSLLWYTSFKYCSQIVWIFVKSFYTWLIYWQLVINIYTNFAKVHFC